MPRWKAWQVKELHDRQIKDLRDDIVRELTGFPELYATKLEAEAARKVSEQINADHVGRREFDEIKHRLDVANGRRLGLVGAAALITVLLSLYLSTLTSNQVSHAQVSDQIRSEAPWITDRPRVEARLDLLAQQVQVMRLRLASIETLDRFFCRTRTPKLPGC